MATAEHVKEIVATNIGAIPRIVVPYPIDPDTGECAGGIVLARGRNNCGKTTLNDAIETMVTGRGKIAARDGTPFGTMEFLNMRLRVGAKTTRTGELEVHGLDGKLDISDIVDPGIKDAVSADAKRIKAIISVAKAKADPKLFDELIGDNQALISPETFKTQDLVEMAARVKRDMEGGAQVAERAAENANSKARALREASAGVDLEQPCDQQQLQGELESALQAVAIIKNRASRADELRIAATAARRELTQAESSYEGLSVEQSAAREAEAREDEARAQTELRAAEEALRAAQQRHNSACNFVAVCVKDKKAAEAHERNMTGWRNSVAAAENIDNPTSKEISDAAIRVETARAAHDTGVLVRRAKEQAAEAMGHQKEGGRHTLAAARLRDAAKEAEAVLSSVVADLKLPLRVESGRLVMASGDQEGVPFARQSMGTRLAIAAPLAISVLPKGDIFTLKQEGWEGLDLDNRRMLLSLVKAAKVVLYSAEADTHQEPGELRAELFEAE